MNEKSVILENAINLFLGDLMFCYLAKGENFRLREYLLFCG